MNLKKCIARKNKNKRVHFKFTTHSPLLRRGKGEAKETRKFEMHPNKPRFTKKPHLIKIKNEPCLLF
jgi:hypothetical protein